MVQATLDADVSLNDLVRRSQAGEVGAFEEIYRRHEKRIYNLVLQTLGNESDAADITQEVFVRAYSALSKLRTEEAFSAWLHRVAVNLCWDHLRRLKRSNSVSLDEPAFEDQEEPLSIPDWSENPEQRFQSTEMQAVIRKALASLSADHRAVVVLHHLHGMDLSQIAKILKCPEGTVKSRLARARDELKRKLRSYVEVA